MNAEASGDQAPPVAGGLYALSAFLIWGLSPVYWKALKHVPAFEIILHRIVWSFLFLVPILAARRQGSEFLRILKTPRVLSVLCLTTVIVAGNWFIYIWAINSGHVLQTSLGYYITPLVNVLLGMVFLGERLRRAQVISVLLALAGVTYLTVHYGAMPWVSLALALSFGTYGLIRKVAPVSALVGLSVETLLLSIPALAFLFWFEAAGTGAFRHAGFRTDLLLMGASLVTGLPLLLFTTGARLIHFTTLGFLQYTAPSCTFLLAVLVFGEPLDPPLVITFCLIWTALAIFTADSWRQYKKAASR